MDELPLSKIHKSALNNLRNQFAALTDNRQACKVHHILPDVLMSALCAMICGCDDFSAMGAFAKHRLEWLREFLPLEKGAPSHDTFRNVFMMIKPDDFASVLNQWFGSLAGKHIAIDGKAIRSSFDQERGKCLIILLRAWIDEHSLSAGQVACLEKSNEIEAIPRLLDMLELSGATVTIDAAGCQREIAQQIDEAGAAYLLGLKGNQKTSYERVIEHFRESSIAKYASSEELGHGRYEKRECWVEDDLSFFDKSWKWEGLTSVVHIRRETCRKGSRGTDGSETSVEDHYYLSSCEADAEKILTTIRDHWSVENRCHWMLDVVFGEDANTVKDRTSARNLSSLRDLSLHLLRGHPSKSSIPKKRLNAMLDPNFRSEIICNLHT